jgi:dihydroxyacetone kinase-like protein
MEIDSELQGRVLESLAATVIAHAAELSDLDRAIGDGDHGANLNRGFKAVQQHASELAVVPLGQALAEIGKQLVMTVGGASGPLYGTFFMALGERFGSGRRFTHEEIVTAFDGAIAAVKARGRSDAGQKTMLDVLVPVQEELRAGGPDVLDRVRARADAAAAATIPMIAGRGRAAFLGARSAGHMDPGARSSALMIVSVCESLQTAAGPSHAE